MSLDAARIVKNVVDRLEAHREHLKEYFSAGPPPPGLTPVTDEAFMDWISLKVQQESPPTPLLFPLLDRNGDPVLHERYELKLDDAGVPILDPMTGMPLYWEGGEPVQELRVVSPWLAQLYLKKRTPEGKQTAQPLIDGAEAILRRYERLMAKQGAMV